MELTIFSDLHLNKVPEKMDIQGDVGIIAGDISDNIEVVVSFLSKLSKNFNYILFTAGNIELWNRNTNFKNPLDKLTFIQNNTPKNVIVLDTVKYVKMKKIVFAGNIYLKEEAVTQNDLNNVETTISSKNYFKKLSRKKIQRLYTVIKEVNPNVIVTHYPPIPITIFKKSEILQNVNNQKLWIFGHYHQYKNFISYDPFNKNICYVCNTDWNKPLKLKF